MMRYYQHVQITLAEIKGQSVLLVHVLSGCMFQCYQCLNYDELIKKKHDHYLSIDDIVRIIQRQEVLIDTIVLSGGEVLLASLDDLINDLKAIKKVTKKPIILYTTGYFPEKMEVLIDESLVDGYHIDMKLPYHLIHEHDQDLVKLTLGKTLHKDEITNLLKALDIVVRYDQGLNQIRSVRYPFLDESAFDECQIYINHLNELYQKNTPYEVHSFYSKKPD